MNIAVSESDNLPNGWILAKIDYICKLIGGGTPSRNNSDYFNGDIVWLTPTEISKNSIQKIYDSKEKITKLGLKKSSAKMIPINSVLLTSRASIGYVAIAGTNVSTNQGFASFSCNDVIFNYYLAYWLWSRKNFLESEATGTTFKEISKSKLREIQISLPPLAEQKRIVSKIESIFTRIEKMRTQLKLISEMLHKLRSSVLRQAFEGKLMPQDPDDEPAEVVLKRIHKASEKKLVLEKYNLPKKWINLELQNCVEILDNKRVPVNASQRERRRGIVPYYGSTGQVGWIDDYLFDEELVLLGEDAAPFLDNFKDKAYLVSGKSWVNNHAHVLRGIKNLLLNKFLCYFLNQFDYHEYVTGTTRLKLNQARMKAIPVLLPPLAEQKRIVSKIESIFIRIDAVERYIESTLALLDSLKNSALKQAFEGRLVPQDPDDEPAEILLQTIKHEKQLIEGQKLSYRRKNVR